MAYLSHNHCLETLEFTMDASRYRKHYNKLANRAPDGSIQSDSDETIYVKMLWQRLLEAYIVPNGAREVNLPSDVRDPLLALCNSSLPPHPSALEPAVTSVHKLMEESVLVPFINSLYPSTISSSPEFLSNHSTEDFTHTHAKSYDDRAQSHRHHSRDHDRRSSPPPASAVSASLNYHTNPHRASAPSSFSQLARGFHIGGNKGFLQLTHHQPTTSHAPHPHALPSSAASTSRPTSTASTMSAALSTHASNSSTASQGDTAMTDDSSATTSMGVTSSTGNNGGASPTYSGSAVSDALMTPPTTPPMSDYYACGGSPPTTATGSYGHAGHHGFAAVQQSQSPRSSRGDAGMGAWKKMRSSFGFKKRGGAGGSASLREEEDDEMAS